MQFPDGSDLPTEVGNAGFLKIHVLDGFVKSRKNPSPSMGEGWGEGAKGTNSTTYIPLSFIPSHKGRGNVTFYEFIKSLLSTTFKNGGVL